MFLQLKNELISCYFYKICAHKTKKKYGSEKRNKKIEPCFPHSLTKNNFFIFSSASIKTKRPLVMKLYQIKMHASQKITRGKIHR